MDPKQLLRGTEYWVSNVSVSPPENLVTAPGLYMCLISLLIFRFFDIIKPYPITKFDKMNNTFGVIFDDILAGIFSALVLTLTLIF